MKLGAQTDDKYAYIMSMKYCLQVRNTKYLDTENLELRMTDTFIISVQQTYKNKGKHMDGEFFKHNDTH
jgi:hypothetical protein